MYAIYWKKIYIIDSVLSEVYRVNKKYSFKKYLMLYLIDILGAQMASIVFS